MTQPPEAGDLRALRGLSETAFLDAEGDDAKIEAAFDAYEHLTDHMHKWLPALLDQIETLQTEAELFDADHADQNRMVDRIADLIGIPHDQELDVTAFELWFSDVQRPPALSPAPSQGDVELRVAVALWLEDSRRAAPNVAKNRDAAAFQANLHKAEQEKWLGQARAAIAAMPVSAGYREGLEAAARIAARDRINPVTGERIAAAIRALSDDDGKEGR